jgi:DNA polymerase-3 subunit delta'
MILMHASTQKQVDNFLKSPLHALSLSGEPGAGKGTLAKFIAAQVLKIDHGITEHPYFSQLDGNDKVGIDEIRQLQTFLKLKVPGKAVYKRTVLLENLDGLRHEAQNALLKTIEEPPADTIIIVTYSLTNKVLPTLHSRLQNIKVMPVDLESAEQTLSDQFNQKLIKQSYYMSGGQPGIMFSLLEKESSHPLIGAIEEARRVLGMSRFERLNQVDKLIKNKDVATSSILDGLYRLIDAGYKQALEKRRADELKPFSVRLKLIEQAIRDLQENVQPKLVLSRLFTEL